MVMRFVEDRDGVPLSYPGCVATSIGPAGRGADGYPAIYLLSRASEDHLPTALAHERTKLCQLLLLTQESLVLPL